MAPCGLQQPACDLGTKPSRAAVARTPPHPAGKKRACPASALLPASPISTKRFTRRPPRSTRFTHHTGRGQASSLLSLDGVTSAEADRIQASMDGNLTDAEASASHIAGAGGWLLESGQRGDSGPPVDCAARDKPLGYKPFPEIEAYHIPQVSLGQVYGVSTRISRCMPATHRSWTWCWPLIYCTGT
jgi:hypothetical protein